MPPYVTLGLAAQGATGVRSSRKEYRRRPHAEWTGTPSCSGGYAWYAGETRTCGQEPGLPYDHASRRTYFGAEGPTGAAGDTAAGGPALRGMSMPCATSASCCCQPCSHFQPAVMALTAAAVMKATIWFWSRWAPGTAWAISPANHPAAIAKTGVRIATNLPISDASLGADDGATEEAAEGGEFVMSLLNEGGVLRRLAQITYFCVLDLLTDIVAETRGGGQGIGASARGSASFCLLLFSGHLPDYLLLFALTGTGSPFTPFTLPLQFRPKRLLPNHHRSTSTKAKRHLRVRPLFCWGRQLQVSKPRGFRPYRGNIGR